MLFLLSKEATKIMNILTLFLSQMNKENRSNEIRKIDLLNKNYSINLYFFSITDIAPLILSTFYFICPK